MDRYDVAIALLKKRPELIGKAWITPFAYPEGALFEFASSGRTMCPTQIKENPERAQHHCGISIEIIDAICDDDKIPDDSIDITLDSLESFARVQRLLDEAYPERVAYSAARRANDAY